MQAPSAVDDKQLKELGIKKDIKKINFLVFKFIFTSERSTNFSFIIASDKSF